MRQIKIMRETERARDREKGRRDNYLASAYAGGKAVWAKPVCKSNSASLLVDLRCANFDAQSFTQPHSSRNAGSFRFRACAGKILGIGRI